VRAALKTIKYDPGNDNSDSLGLSIRFYQLWLAHAINCRLEWILRLPEVLRKGTDKI
jgi:hypothetical protein